MSTLLVHITMQLAVLLTSLLVIHHRFEASHNQPVSIRIGLKYWWGQCCDSDSRSPMGSDSPRCRCWRKIAGLWCE